MVQGSWCRGLALLMDKIIFALVRPRRHTTVLSNKLGFHKLARPLAPLRYLWN